MEDGAPFVPGNKLAAWTVGRSALDGGCSIDVAVLGSPSIDAQLDDVVTNLSGDPRIASATAVLINAVTPTLVELNAFDAVLVLINSYPQDTVVLGDNLADYVDSGGGVVLALFALRASTPTIMGRFMSSDYYCIEQSSGNRLMGHATLGTVHVPESPLMTGVTTFDGGDRSFRSPAPPHALATRIADWSTGEVLIAERTDLSGGRVDLGMFPVSELQAAGGWLTNTDGAIILRNAVVRASGCEDASPVEPTTWGAIKAQLR